MKTNDKKRFIKNLCDSVKKELLTKAAKMPENWDGWELRELIAAKFKDETILGRDKRNTRYKNYINEVITRNL